MSEAIVTDATGLLRDQKDFVFTNISDQASSAVKLSAARVERPREVDKAYGLSRSQKGEIGAKC